MTARFYEPFAEDLAQPLNNLPTGNVASIRVALLDATYTFSAAHQFRSATGFVGATLLTSPVVAGISVSAGLWNASNVVFTGDPGEIGNIVTQYVFYEDTGAAATDRLLWYDNEAPELPLTLNGANVTLDLTNGIARIRGTV